LPDLAFAEAGYAAEHFVSGHPIVAHVYNNIIARSGA
jgi:hypothetical protein